MLSEVANYEPEAKNMGDEIQNFTTSLSQIEKGLELVHRYQKKVAEQRRNPSENDTSKECLEEATNNVHHSLYDQRKHLKILEQSLSNPASSTSSPPVSPDGPSVKTCLPRLRQKHYSLICEFHDLQKHFAEQQKLVLLQELQRVSSEASESDLYMTLNESLFSSENTPSDRPSPQFLEALQSQQRELFKLESGVEEVAQMMAELGLHIQVQDMTPPSPRTQRQASLVAEQISLHTLVEIEPSLKEPSLGPAWACLQRHRDVWVIILTTILFFVGLTASIVYICYYFMHREQMSK